MEKNVIVSKKTDKRKQGRLNRAAGARLERKVRKNLELNGWIVDKWSNNVDLENKKLTEAKRKFNPYKKILGIGTGFPDFIRFKINKKKKLYEIEGVEVKKKGFLDKSEKEKCRWYLENNIFSKIVIAKPVKNGRRINIDYIDFKK